MSNPKITYFKKTNTNSLEKKRQLLFEGPKTATSI